MKLAITFMFFICMLGFNSAEQASAFELRMEIGYPLMAGATGIKRIWALKSVPLTVVSGASVGESVDVSIICRELGGCEVHGKTMQGGSRCDSKIGIDATAVVLQINSSEAVLLIEPFPIEVDAGLFDQLRLEKGITKYVYVEYSCDEDSLRVSRIRPAGQVRQTPIVWK